jgi:predicted ATPase/DNA-binding CsgD family transcriptional regulator
MAGRAHRTGNLPAETTSFVGRRQEIAQLRRTLASARLVSLVGPGGVGKTRLALRVGADLGSSIPGGAWLVELADIQDPALIANVVMASLDLRDQTSTEPRTLVLSHLRDAALLLIVDNCEHLLPAAAHLISDMLRAAPALRVLATSREPLAVAGEQVVPVPPLPLPGAHAPEPLAQLRLNESVILFSERAAAATGRFALAESNAAVVADLCRRLDGLPLAIELAAVRTRVLSVEQVLARLSDRFNLLSAGGRAALPRHQTLRTTIEWSHDLLAPRERAMLRRLCGFAGRFLLEDVEEVCTSPEVPAERVLELLSSLVDRSLVIKTDEHGIACYHLHETMREFAALKLRESGEEAMLEERCTEHYASRCRDTAEEGRFRLVEWLAWMEVEIDNIRAVLRRCIARRDAIRGLYLAASLGWYWMTRATSEGIRWLDELLALQGGDAASNAQACFVRGFLAVLQSDPATARPTLERAAAAAREAGELRRLTESLAMGAVAALMDGDAPASDRLLEAAGAVPGSPDDYQARISILQTRAIAAILRGDVAAVTAAAAEGERLSREVGDLYGLEMQLLNLGGAQLMSGDVELTKPLYREGLRIAQRIDDRISQMHFLVGLAFVAGDAGQARLAAHLLGAAETLRSESGGGIIATLAPFAAMAEESARTSLGADGYAAAIAEGRRLSRDAAVTLALGTRVLDTTPSADVSATSPLGRREADVARLVADGLSNKQIGVRLFISERTVESHVRNILNKLGFSTRAQIAAWVAGLQR